MLHFNAIIEDYEPRKEIYEFLKDKTWEEPLMRTDETGFLCGLLREKKPRYILEVGVYSGSTTAIMAQCMCDIGVPCVIHSVDLARFCIRSLTKPFG